jgi:gliding motility-associated-like protein
LASLDVSKNKALKILICFSNQIATLELQNCPELTSLSCSRNTLTNLDLSLNPQLISLECDANSLESLNLKNGQNAILQKLNTTSNNKLFCIQVDDRAFSENNWKDIDPWTKFNTDCTFTNESPAAYNDLYETDDNTILMVPAGSGILANDTDPETDTLISVLETDVTHGQLELNEDGSFTYTPDPYFFGEDSFTYTAGDGALFSNTAEVKIIVKLVNEIPLAEDDSYTISQGETLVVNNENGVLRNDTDPDNELKEVSLVTDVSSGTLLLDSNGSFSYVPEANFYGADHFTYRVFDGYVYSAAAVVTIDVTEGYEMVIPNAFTPNGDGINDTFRPVFRGFTNIRIQVFDTWGNLVFSQEGSDITGWPGLIRNAQAENGNYLYRINASPVSGEQIEREGLFTLIR